MEQMDKTDGVKHPADSGGKTPMNTNYNATCSADHNVVVTDRGFRATTVRCWRTSDRGR